MSQFSVSSVKFAAYNTNSALQNTDVAHFKFCLYLLLLMIFNPMVFFFILLVKLKNLEAI